MFCAIFCPLSSFVVLFSWGGVFGFILPKSVDMVCLLSWRVGGCISLSVGLLDVLDQRTPRVLCSPSVPTSADQVVFQNGC